MSRPRRVHLEDFLGHAVCDPDGRRVGHIEEVRAVRRGDRYEVVEYLLGVGALITRLSIVRRLLGRKPRTLVASWDQMDISNPDRPRLTCPADRLAVE
jgi:hypothetical protein